MAYCKDSNCGYYYQKDGEDYPRCQYPDNDPFPAPCEQENYYEPPDIDDDTGFDPYAGCYTDDC